MHSRPISRRTFLKTGSLGFGCVLGAGGIHAFTEPVIPSSPQASNLAIRRNIAALDLKDPSVKILRDAVGILKKRSPLDPTGWLAHVANHATFCATNEYVNQVHYNWFLLPWHRGYLYTLEKKLREAVREPHLALHYWDWTKHPFIPAHYWGKDNPLYNGSRMVSPADIIPYDFINVGAALRTTNFNIFGGYPHVKSAEEQQRDGIAEQTFHNNLHNWIGGDMAGFTNSGNDMIFTGHHGNLDRVWNAWLSYHPENQNPRSNEWLEHTFYFTDEKGKPLNLKVKDLLNTRDLGYDFDNLDFNPVYCNPFSPDMCPQAAEDKTSNTIIIRPSEIQRSILRESTAKTSRASLSFDRMELPYQPYCARLFFEFQAGEMTGAPLITQYISTFTALPIGKPYTGLLQRDVCLQLEINNTAAKLIAGAKEINVRLVPVQLSGRTVPAIDLQLKSAVLNLLS
ncbi:MAG TPA: tyrosinase family protein [Flavisolibacter sp.]|jgi:hypothetical protein|nr:tyrosinase family protein [Flavisolibacter sp.]